MFDVRGLLKYLIDRGAAEVLLTFFQFVDKNTARLRNNKKDDRRKSYGNFIDLIIYF